MEKDSLLFCLLFCKCDDGGGGGGGGDDENDDDDDLENLFKPPIYRTLEEYIL